VVNIFVLLAVSARLGLCRFNLLLFLSFLLL
jgi:hypothetical protein